MRGTMNDDVTFNRGISMATPNCPFCDGPTEAGAVYGDRYQLKWMPSDASLLLGIWAVGGESIGSGGAMMMTRPRVKGYRCTKCRKIICDY